MTIPAEMTKEPKPARALELALKTCAEDADLTAGQRAWLFSRFMPEVHRSAHLERINKRDHQWVTYGSTVGGIAAASLTTLIASAPSANTWLRILTVLVSILAAVAAAAERSFRYGPRWRLYRQTSVDLTSAGWRFVTSQGGPSSVGQRLPAEDRRPGAPPLTDGHQPREDAQSSEQATNAFDVLYERAENILSKHQAEYLDDIALIDRGANRDVAGQHRTR